MTPFHAEPSPHDHPPDHPPDHLPAIAPSNRRKPTQRVAVLITTRSSIGRRVLRGVAMFARPVKPWIIRAGPALMDVIPSLKMWNPNGIIAHIAKPNLAEALKEINKPLVNVSNGLAESDIVRVGVDDYAVGRTAAKYLLDRGFTNLAFCGEMGTRYAVDRRNGFVDCVEEHGHRCHEFDCYLNQESRSRVWDWTTSEVDQRLSDWLISLPKPVGLFAYQDYLGLAISEACRQSDLQVPEEIALVGVDDDETSCELADPPLSSVRSPMQQVGYQAAKVLDRMMAGEPPPTEPILFSPIGVVTRQSSDITATDDVEVAKALRFIRENADHPIQVSDVISVTSVSRRSLEQRFRKVLGRTLLDEIHRVHFDQAMRLLAETDLPISRIAIDSGFGGVARMNAVFQKLTGLSPGEQRQQIRKR